LSRVQFWLSVLSSFQIMSESAQDKQTDGQTDGQARHVLRPITVSNKSKHCGLPAPNVSI